MPYGRTVPLQVYSIQEGNAALPRKLAAAAKLQALQLGTAVQAVRRDTTTGQYSLMAVQAVHCHSTIGQCSLTAVQSPTHAASADCVSNNQEVSATHTQTSHQQSDINLQQKVADVSDSPALFGPFDGVVLATPLEGSGIELQGVLPAGRALPKREYQSTVTTYVTGELNPHYFKVSEDATCMRHL
jgi:hypothetical protein